MKRTCHLVLIALSLLASPLHAQAVATDADSLFEFAFITDIHQSSPSADTRVADRNVASFVEYCNQTPSLALACFGGDLFNSYDTDRLQALWCMRRAHSFFDSLKLPFYPTRGNHDSNGKRRLANRTPDNSQIITDLEYHNLWSPLSELNPLYHPEGVVVNPAEPNGNYFYRDFPRQRVRFIVLNDYHYDFMEKHGYTGEQLRWLGEQALDFSAYADAREWGVILVGHAFVGKADRYAIVRILQAFQQGRDIVENSEGIVIQGRFTQQGPMQLIGCFHGHYHADMYNNKAGFNIIGVARGFATDGEIGTIDELCFDHIIINVREKTIRERRIGHGTDRLYRYDQPQRLLPMPLFDEAEGAAAFIHAGSSGQTLTVTSLKDNGRPGTLRWAVQQPGARTIRFAVSGTIQLTSPLVIEHDSITILGQSAPDHGEVILTGQPVHLKASEAALRYLTLRPGANGLVLAATEGTLCGGLLIGRDDKPQHDVMIDHLTIADARGDLFSCARCSGVTVQYCLFENSLTGHGVMFGGFRSSYLDNYLRGLQTHSPLFPSSDGDQKWVDLQENVIENWGSEAATGGGHHGMINLTYTFFEPGPQTENPNTLLEVHPDGTGRYYLEQNYLMDRALGNESEYVNDRSGVPYMVAPADSARWLSLPPIQRPVEGRFAASCLSIAMFPNVPLTEMKPVQAIPSIVKLSAGNKKR